MKAARGNRWGHRDATMILVAYRHGLRASELVDLRWDQVEFRTATLHVRRVKQGTPSTHPILGDELRALRRLQREQEPKSPSCSPRSAGPPSAPPGSPAWSSGRAGRPSWRSRRIRTCSDTPAATRWRTRGTTQGRCRPTWAPQHPAHGAVHRAAPDAVQGFLATLIFRREVSASPMAPRSAIIGSNRCPYFLKDSILQQFVRDARSPLGRRVDGRLSRRSVGAASHDHPRAVQSHPNSAPPPRRLCEGHYSRGRTVYVAMKKSSCCPWRCQDSLVLRVALISSFALTFLSSKVTIKVCPSALWPPENACH